MPFGDDIEKTKEWARMGARKPREIEEEQLQRMRSILDKDLAMVENIQDQEEIDEKTQKKLVLLKERIKTYSDKLHVSKSATDITSGGESINKILVEFINGKDNTNTTGIPKAV